VYRTRPKRDFLTDGTSLAEADSLSFAPAGGLFQRHGASSAGIRVFRDDGSNHFRIVESITIPSDQKI